MIKANEYEPQIVKKAYNRRGWIYSKTVAPMEWEYHVAALDQANLQPGENVLEVAVGPGLTAVEIARRVGKETPFHGMDISTGMLALTEQRLRENGFSQFTLKEGNASQIPFPSNTFDVLYNGYMLGQAIRNFDDLLIYIALQAKVGETLQLTVLRDGVKKDFQVTLASRPQSKTTP